MSDLDAPPLQPSCGPHCGTKDGVTKHCELCHGMRSPADLQDHVITRERALTTPATPVP